MTSRRWLNLAVQFLGFGLGVGLLVWCASLALKPENRAQLEKLRDAPPSLVLAMLGLSVLGLALDGSVFHLLIGPVKRLKWIDVQAVNAVAVALNYLPFKLGLIARVLIHNRRDHIPILTVGAWLVATAGALAAAAGPIVLAGLWHGRVNTAWVLTVVLAAAVITTVAVLCARMLAGEPGLARIHAIASRLGPLSKLARSQAFVRLHSGAVMVSHPWAFAPAVATRLVHFGVQAVRFYVAARMIGVELPFETAVLAGSLYFVIGVVSPGGVAGSREGGTTWLIASLGLSSAAAESLAIVALVIGAAEMIVNLAAGGLAFIYLQPHRLLGRREPVT